MSRDSLVEEIGALRADLMRMNSTIHSLRGMVIHQTCRELGMTSRNNTKQHFRAMAPLEQRLRMLVESFPMSATTLPKETNYNSLAPPLATLLWNSIPGKVHIIAGYLVDHDQDALWYISPMGDKRWIINDVLTMGAHPNDMLGYLLLIKLLVTRTRERHRCNPVVPQLWIEFIHWASNKAVNQSVAHVLDQVRALEPPIIKNISGPTAVTMET